MRTLLSLFLFSVATIVAAQDRLEPTVQPKEDAPLCTRLYSQETRRLLNPDNAEWGVLRCPSLMTETSLTYDAAAHALVYTEIEGILWGSVCDATTRRVEEGNCITIENLKEPVNYRAPATKRAVLPIPDSTARKLNALWLAAINNCEENDMDILDGCTYGFFAGGKEAEAHGSEEGWVMVPRLTALADALMSATKNGDTNALQQLQSEIEELCLLFCSEE